MTPYIRPTLTEVAPISMLLQPIWQFWQGPLPDHIAFCMETVERHHPGRVKLLHEIPSECWQVFGREPDPSMPIQAQADLLRAYLLWKHGGFWLDCDFVCLKPVDCLIPQVPPFPHMAVYTRPDLVKLFGTVNGIARSHDVDFLWCQLWSPIVDPWLALLRLRLRQQEGRSFVWGDYGGIPLDEVLLQAADPGVCEVSPDAISPLRRLAYGWDTYVSPAEAADWHLPETTVGVQLVNSVSGEYLQKKTAEEWLMSDTVIGRLFRTAVERMP